jgi:6,7-dimethyl-8-ribityllumazine synthase
MSDVDGRNGLNLHVVAPATLPAASLRAAVLVARFNEILTERLQAGATRTLSAAGVGRIDVIEVPGAFELPAVAAAIARRGLHQLIVALGAVIRGNTPHFDHVCNQAAAGLARVAVDHAIPLGFGVLTLDTLEQGFDRVGGKLGNKGEEAARVALQMAAVLGAIAELR